MPRPCPAWFAVALLACGRAAPPTAPAARSPQPVPEARSEGAGPKGQVAPPPAEPPIVLAPDAGLRVIHEGRGSVAAAPGYLVILEPDALHLRAVDAASGAPVWRIAVQAQARGRQTLHLHREQVIVHAGNRRIHVELGSGERIADVPGFANGGDGRCGVQVLEGGADASDAWLPPAPHGSACADRCDCDMQPFDCRTGAAIGPHLAVDTVHFYNPEGTEHDTTCWRPPALLVRAARATLVQLEDGAPTIFGLDPVSGARLWQRRDLGGALAAYATVAGADASGELCWLADGAALFVVECATGKTRWQAQLAAPGRPGATAIDAQGDALRIQNRREDRTVIQLRALAGGRPRWQRELPGDRLALVAGEPPPASDDPLAAYELIDAATGARRGEIAVDGGRTLRTDPEGGWLRVGDGVDEFDTRGQLRRRQALANSERVVAVTGQHLVELGPAGARVLRRDGLQPVLSLPGTWSRVPTPAALGPGALLLSEHREVGPGRFVLLRP